MERKEKPRKKHKHYHDIRCEQCGTKIDVDLALELEDFDYINKDKTKINIYCGCCGSSVMVKL